MFQRKILRENSSKLVNAAINKRIDAENQGGEGSSSAEKELTSQINKRIKLMRKSKIDSQNQSLFPLLFLFVIIPLCINYRQEITIDV